MKETIIKIIEMLQAILNSLASAPAKVVEAVKPALPAGVMPWMEIARAEVGVKEVDGTGDNPRVLEYHSKTTLKSTDDSVAWCSSFINWCMNKAGYEGTGSAAARSWLGYGKKLSKFQPGCIVVFKRGNSSWQGHVAFGLEEGRTLVKVLGGNQSKRRLCRVLFARRRAWLHVADRERALVEIVDWRGSPGISIQ